MDILRNILVISVIFATNLTAKASDKDVEFPFVFEIRRALLDRPADIYECPSEDCKIIQTIPQYCVIEYYHKVFDDEKGYDNFIRIQSYSCLRVSTVKDEDRNQRFDGYIKDDNTLYPFNTFEVVSFSGSHPSKVIKPFQYRKCREETCPIIFDSRKDNLQSLLGENSCTIYAYSSPFFDKYDGGWLPTISACDALKKEGFVRLLN
ncbi:hypothetical protein [Bartonella sp. HY038]|uniref:hypothetical protein n=1 Tax=Bartonella sp. HY038 TaxID=2759660 RepID=UPI0015FB9CA6|nr:hypothetical protein [Bartonella sp. HY038]